MKKFLLLIPVLLACLSGCEKEDPVVIALRNQAKLFAGRREQFEGKYKIISATSNIPVDVNLDGFTSKDLLKEIPVFSEMSIVRIEAVQRADNPFFFIGQPWPEQHIWINAKRWNGGPGIEYDDKLIVEYAQQGGEWVITFSDDSKELFLQPEDTKPENPYRLVRPESLTVDEQGRLNFVNRRYLYTREGVKEVVVKSVYERYAKLI